MSRQRKSTPLPMVRYNNKVREQRLRKLIKDNFSPKDHFVIFKYSFPHRLEVETAKKVFSQYIKELQGKGNSIRYIKATRKGKKGKVIHYLIMGAEIPSDLLKYVWRFYSDIQPTIEEIADMRLSKVIKPFISSELYRLKKHERGYTTSRNLKR